MTGLIPCLFLPSMVNLVPAVLTENLFMDNHTDCNFLLSKEGQQSLVDLHVDGIISYLGV